jgi:hypothetical protein
MAEPSTVILFGTGVRSVTGSFLSSEIPHGQNEQEAAIVETETGSIHGKSRIAACAQRVSGASPNSGRPVRNRSWGENVIVVTIRPDLSGAKR